MWLIIKNGFVSVVEHRDDPGTLIVRARKREHLQAIMEGVEQRFIEETRDADYLFRVYVPRKEFSRMLLNAAKGIDYDNFKNAIEDHELHDAAFKIWSILYGLQNQGGLNGRTNGRKREA